MTSRILVFNPDTTGPASVAIQVVNPDGSNAWTTTFEMAANGAFAVALPTSIPAGFTGGAVVSSDKNVQAFVIDSNSADSARDQYPGVMGPGTTLSLPLITQNSTIAVQNTSSAIANITLHYYDQNGVEEGSQTGSIPSLASSFFQASTLLPVPSFPSTVKITADQIVAAAEQILIGSDTVAFRGLTASDNDTTLYLNTARRILTSGVLSSWSELDVRNNGTNPTTITVQFYSTSGVAVGSPEVATSVPVNGMASFSTSGTSATDLGTNFSGWAKVSSSGEPIAFYALNFQNYGNTLSGNEGIPSSQQGAQFVCGDTYRTNSPAQYSQVSLLNVGSGSGSVTVTLYDPLSGASLASQSYSIAANQLVTADLSDAAFGGAGQSFEGMAIVSATGAQIVTSVYTPNSIGGPSAYSCSKLQ